jgi:hypothetical protein
VSDGATTRPPEKTVPATTKAAGTASSATAYQVQRTRQRQSRRAQRRSPVRPWATAVMIRADVIGPR